ncbi:MAG TPA: phosphotransferase [Candidatus Saccharimonadales bacterium]|nr:phosphotransferase [Candidatus Saccharimonadales bacterium]
MKPPTTHPAPDEILDRGYERVTSSLDGLASARFAYAKLRKDGEYYFTKFKISPDARAGALLNDVSWCQAIGAIDTTRPLNFRAPRIIENDGAGEWYVAQWIDGQVRVGPDSFGSSLDRYLETYVQALIDVDRVPAESVKAFFGGGQGSTATPPLTHRWSEWTPKPLREGQLQQSDVQRAAALVDQYGRFVESRFQHGDFVPWHFMTDTRGQLWLIDGEHASYAKPRYYDLAYIYSRIFCRMEDPGRAMRLIKLFMEWSTRSLYDLYPALLPVMVARAIGLQFDAINDYPEIDYRHRAQDFMARCLSEDPKQLLEL